MRDIIRVGKIIGTERDNYINYQTTSISRIYYAIPRQAISKCLYRMSFWKNEKTGEDITSLHQKLWTFIFSLVFIMLPGRAVQAWYYVAGHIFPISYPNRCYNTIVILLRYEKTSG